MLLNLVYGDLKSCPNLIWADGISGGVLLFLKQTNNKI